MSNIVLVTGGAGFIGSHLAPKLLAAGYRLRILDNLSTQIHGALPTDLEWLNTEGIEFVRGSVAERDTWTRALKDVGTVVHLAAETGTGQSMYEVARYNMVNTHGTALLFDVLAQEKTRTVRRVILASSRSVYGEGAYHCMSCGLDPVYPDSRTPEALAAHRWDYACPRCNSTLTAKPTSESDRVRPGSIYAATKYAQEDLTRIACESLGIDYVIYRFQNVYGERQSLNNPYTGILSIFSTRIRRDLVLPLFEDGEESRDFVHVEDVVTAVTMGVASTDAINRTFNVGSGVPCSVRQVAEELSRALGKTPNVQVTGQYRVGDIRHNYADMTASASVLGFKPVISLKEGLGRFAAWVHTQPLPVDRLEEANKELRARNLMG
ncbi:dTDP-L-rhamnose 4-epimerase [Ralstonia mannitolilytica]|uniref:NAD-dependent epimerase/dehydratase family protein n=2 Tax=Ralstonia mannitolilytica TaxID=105219 RepID=UPI0007B011D9|nr:NAD-dependent epimerase/dehydratase family protein [Ralstonia mannitolilytica]ANA34119.1 epimerase [Ralstonia mannitolilytica]CAJ0777152.1 dTDP-L-rhamnose 4-epimerase [Ralstonia mannitolilytica]